MKAIRIGFSVLIGGLILGRPDVYGQDHGHLNAGAVTPTPGAQAVWDNGADFIASSGFVKTLDLTNSGRFSGYYQGNVTVTALAATPDHSGPEPGAAALGTVFHARLSLLSGPPGGIFGFWETNSTAATGPYLSLAVGETASNMFRITQADGSPTGDPFGHIHGRRLSATKPGFYKVGFQAVDVSTNGPGGGPVHLPTEVLPVWFQAGVNIQSVKPQIDRAEVRFGPPLNTTWQVEYNETLSPTNWLPAGDPVSGRDYFLDFIHPGESGTNRFYRARRITP